MMNRTTTLTLLAAMGLAMLAVADARADGPVVMKIVIGQPAPAASDSAASGDVQFNHCGTFAAPAQDAAVQGTADPNDAAPATDGQGKAVPNTAAPSTTQKADTNTDVSHPPRGPRGRKHGLESMPVVTLIPPPSDRSDRPDFNADRSDRPDFNGQNRNALPPAIHLIGGHPGSTSEGPRTTPGRPQAGSAAKLPTQADPGRQGHGPLNPR